MSFQSNEATGNLFFTLKVTLEKTQTKFISVTFNETGWMKDEAIFSVNYRTIGIDFQQPSYIA